MRCKLNDNCYTFAASTYLLYFMLKALIVDDEIASLRTLEILLGQYAKHIEIIGVAHSASEGVQTVSMYNPDIIFLDIEMPGGSGFDFLESCAHRNFDVIFITAYNNYAIKAFKYSAIDYLLKPIEIEELHGALEKVIRRRYSNIDGRNKYYALFENIREIVPRKLVVQTDERYECLDISSIVLVESRANGSQIKFADGSEVVVNNPFTELSTLLEERSFAFISPSQQVNLEMVRKLTSSPECRIEFKNQLTIPVNPEYYKRISKHFEEISK